MRKGFTLIELLVVIAIIAILSIVVVLTLNPSEMLRSSRDSSRLSDLSTLEKAIAVYTTDQATQGGGGSLGTVNTVYISIPDPAATTSAGNACPSLNLPILPTGYVYHCAGPNYYRNTDASGWIPLNLKNVSLGSPLSNLPIDPQNASSSRLYYSYITNGQNYELTATMESQKYKLGGSNDIVSGDGGTLATVYEKGSKLGLEPLDYGDPSLVGYWTFDEGTGTTAWDYSGNNASGSWSGGSSYMSGKIGAYAGNFNGNNNYVGTIANTLPLGSNPRSVFAWIYFTGSGSSGTAYAISSYGDVTVSSGLSELYLSSGNVSFASHLNNFGSGFVVATNTWNFIGFTYNGNTSMTIYYNGQSQTAGITALNTVLPGSDPANIGQRAANNGNFFPGQIDDVRIYNRALSAAEISALYNGGK